MRISRSRLFGTMAVVAVLVGGAPSALADAPTQVSASQTVDTHEITSKVGLRYVKSTKTFKGRVTYIAEGVSPTEAGCVKSRKVTLFKVTKTGAKKLAAKQTSLMGAFKFRFSKRQSGKYRAKVAPKAFSDVYGDLVDCSGAKKTIRV